MLDDRLDALRRLFEEGDGLLRTAGSAAQVSAAPGSDSTESVSVTLDGQGQVVGVSVVVSWQRRLGAEGLPGAVVEAVRDASMRRLNAWGEAYGEDGGDPSAHATGASAGGIFVAGGAVAEPVELDRGDFQRRLQAAATGQMSDADRRAALIELLELAEAIERGIDEVSGKLQATIQATHTGQSPDRHVTVTMTGGGDVTDVRFNRAWLREAHEINVGRQITAAFRAAYEKVAAQGVSQLIADSPLGEVQRATQDPLGLAHRLRMTD
jgi:DNA-binding protein YbaB